MKPVRIELEHVSACPLCGSGESDYFDQGKDSLLTEINRYLPNDEPEFYADHLNERRKCSKCSLVFLSPRPTSESLSLIYSRWYEFAYNRVMKDPLHVNERRREFKNYHLKLLKKACSSRGRLLDVGCGSGIFLALAKTEGWSVSGIELDSVAAGWAKDVEKISDIRQGVLSETLKEGELFDVITVFDYLEHTTSPGIDLSILAKHLAPGGTLMIRVPNSNGLQAKWMKQNWLAIIPTHLSYFSEDVISKAIEMNGLDVVHISAGNYRTELDIINQKFGWVINKIKNYFSYRKNRDLTMNAPIAESIAGARGLARLQRFINSILVEQIDHAGGWFNAGNNLTLIAKKIDD